MSNDELKFSATESFLLLINSTVSTALECIGLDWAVFDSYSREQT